MPGTDGYRIYAIGDVHGCREPLAAMMARIEADLDANPHPRPVIVFLGDYLDRGPDIRGVVDDLIALRAGPIPVVHLLGNHDDYCLRYLTEPAAPVTDFLHWLHPTLGGDKTLASYGVAAADYHDPMASHAAFAGAIPDPHVRFLEEAGLYWQAGGYLFVHAGVRPGIPLEDQKKTDLTFIREPFLSDPRSHGYVVVHGHTPVNWVEHHGNRVAVDTGAVFGGMLSCLLVEDDLVFDLRAKGRVPVTTGYGLNGRPSVFG